MTKTLPRVFAEYLETKGFGTAETDIFVGVIPDDIDEGIGVYQYSGTGASRLIEGAINERIQIKIRGGYEAALLKLRSIEKLLVSIGNDIVDSPIKTVVNDNIEIIKVAAQTGKAPLGQDHKQRYEFTQNYNVDYLDKE